MVATTLILIRHGETEWNRARRIQGHLDSALTALGVAQARAGGARLACECIDVVVASDLARVQHTARLLVAGRDLPLMLDENLRERAFGIGEGLTYDAMYEKYPTQDRHIGLVNSEFTLPGGEPRAHFHARIKQTIDQLAATYAGKRVLVVTHGGVLGVVYRWLSSHPLPATEKVAIPNVGYNRIAHVEGLWRLDVWADTTHLGGVVAGGD